MATRRKTEASCRIGLSVYLQTRGGSTRVCMMTMKRKVKTTLAEINLDNIT